MNDDELSVEIVEQRDGDWLVLLRRGEERVGGWRWTERTSTKAGAKRAGRRLMKDYIKETRVLKTYVLSGTQLRPKPATTSKKPWWSYLFGGK